MTQSYPSFVALNCLFVSDTRNVLFFFAAPECTFKKSCSCTAFQRFVQQKFCITLPHFSWTWNFLIDSPTIWICFHPYHFTGVITVISDLQIVKFNVFYTFISLITHQQLVQWIIFFFLNAFSFAFFASIFYFSFTSDCPIQYFFQVLL